jgi:GntR family transcriptional repressor for pyruvate dehydrogenase complex
MSNSALEHATAALRDLVARGHYRPGDRLPPERELADRLGLSRPTMREAIRRLMEIGLLEPRRGSGTYVANVDLDAVFEVRVQLEPYAAALAAVRHTPEQARRLTAVVEAVEANIDEPDLFSLADIEMHAIVAEASGNPVLADVLRRLTELAKLSRSLTSPQRDLRLVGAHDVRALASAILDRDADAAADAMHEHLTTVRTAVGEALDQQRRRMRRPSALVPAMAAVVPLPSTKIET